jgi:hypothetical protein
MAKQILLIGSITDISPARYLAQSFLDLGYDVFAVSDQGGKNVSLVRRRAVDIEKICRESAIKPDLMIFVEGGNMNLLPINFELLNFPKYWWGIDTHNDYRKHLAISRLFDHSFIAQYDFIEKLQNDGVTNISWLPLAYPDSLDPKSTTTRNLDISYIGSSNWKLYPERGELLKAITSNFKNNKVGQAQAAEMIEIYSNSKIVFNYSLKNDINMRFFEAIGAGAMLLTNQIVGNGIDELFVEGEDYVAYGDKADLIAKIEHYLSSDMGRNAISASGRLKVQSAHTYKIRAEYIAGYDSQGLKERHISHSDYSYALTQMDFYADALSGFRKEMKARPYSKQNRLRNVFIAPLLGLLNGLLRLIEKLIDFSRFAK